MARASGTTNRGSSSTPGRLNAAQQHVIRNRIVDYPDSSEEDGPLTPPPAVPPRRGPRRVTKDKAIDKKVWLNGKVEETPDKPRTTKKRPASELEPPRSPVRGATASKKKRSAPPPASLENPPDRHRVRSAPRRLILPRDAYELDGEPQAKGSQYISSQEVRPARPESRLDEPHPNRLKRLRRSSGQNLVHGGAASLSDGESNRSLQEDNGNDDDRLSDGEGDYSGNEVENAEDLDDSLSPDEMDIEVPQWQESSSDDHLQRRNALAHEPASDDEDDVAEDTPRDDRRANRSNSSQGPEDRMSSLAHLRNLTPTTTPSHLRSGHQASATHSLDRDSKIRSSRPRTAQRHQHDGELDDLRAEQRIAGAVKPKTRRDLAYEAERPLWADDQDVEELDQARRASQELQSESDRADEDDADQGPGQGARGHHTRRSQRDPYAAARERDAEWPEETHLIYPVGRQTFQLTAQRANIQQLLREANVQLQYHLAFIDAYPDARNQSQFMRQGLYDIAKGLKLRNIARRIRKDVAYIKILAQVPSNRISIFRNKLCSAVSGLIVSQYSLARRNARQTKSRVDKLLCDQHYIFPGDIEGMLEKDRPYEHPIFIEALSIGYFKASDSVGYRFADDFKSSHPDEDLSEPEVPMCMLATVATCIHYALEEWQSGSRKEGKFFASIYANVYSTHIKILEGIKGQNPFAYHELMADLLNQARDKMSDDADTAADNTLRHIDFAKLRRSHR